MTDPLNSPPDWRHPWLWGMAAVAVRFAAASTLLVVAPDGARYLRMARLLGEGRFGDALTIYPLNPPLYPLLIALGEAVFGHPLVAAVTLSAVLGGLAAVPLYAMARAAWNERVATTGTILYAFLPSAAILHGDAMLEGMFMFFFFAGMAAGWSAVEKKSWGRTILAGFLTACAWLTRPEGAYLVPLFLLACLLRRSRFVPAAAGLYLATAFLAAYPYLAFIKAETGNWGLSANPFAQSLFGLLTGETKATGYPVDERTAEEFREYKDIQSFGKVGGPVVTLAKTTSKVFFYAPVPFLVVGFFHLRRPGVRWGPSAYLLIAAGGYFIPPVLAFVAATPFGYRYILPTCVLLLPVVAIGLLRAAEWIRWRHALTAFLALLCAAMFIRDVRPKRPEKVGLKLAGLAIREKLGEDKRILSMSRQPEFYARGEYIEFPPGAGFADLERIVRERRVDVIVLYARDLRNYEAGLQDRVKAKYPLLGEFPSPAGKDGMPVHAYVTAPR